MNNIKKHVLEWETTTGRDLTARRRANDILKGGMFTYDHFLKKICRV